MRLLVRALVTPLVALACVGWLELLRTAPGPRLGLVLPLREAGHADGVSIFVLFLVVGGGFALLARALPPTGSLVVSACLRAIGAGAVIVVAQASSIELVRQAVIGFDWSAAARSPLPWLFAIGAGLATVFVVVARPVPAPQGLPPHDTPRPSHEAAATP
jgi:hypothetical protein